MSEGTPCYRKKRIENVGEGLLNGTFHSGADSRVSNERIQGETASIVFGREVLQLKSLGKEGKLTHRLVVDVTETLRSRWEV